MLHACCVLSVLAAPLISAFTITTPTNWETSGPATITWTTDSGDQPVFSIELLNLAFHNAFALANNVDSSLGTLQLTLPVVPVGGGYTLEFVNLTNINDVFGQTGAFSIAAFSSTTTSGSATSSSPGSTETQSGAKSGKSSSSSSTTSTTLSDNVPTTSAFGHTISGSSPSSGATSSTNGDSASSPAATIFSAAESLKLNLPTASFAVMALYVIVGAIAV